MIPLGLSIKLYLHCKLCIESVPPDTSPAEWADLAIGWTDPGLQVWCNRHQCNVMHVDFEGHTHPANLDREFDGTLKEVKR